MESSGDGWDQCAAGDMHHARECEDWMKHGEGPGGGGPCYRGHWCSGPPGAGALGVGRTGGFANDELRKDGDEIGKNSLSANSLQQDSCSGAAHLVKRLPNGGKARVVKCGALDVVEANDRNVGRNMKTAVHQCTNRADGGDVVVADERGEVASSLNEFVGGARNPAPAWRRATEAAP